jgi:hypothetical protein
MKHITSLFDYFQKVKRDKRYEKVAIYAYQNFEFGSRRPGGWDEAKNWIDNWTKNNVTNKANGTDEQNTCERMVRYLNESMKKIPNWQY